MKKHFINEKISFSTDNKETISQSMTFLEERLKELGVNRKSVIKTLLVVEETTAILIDKAKEGASLRIQIKKFIGNIEINLSAEGDEADSFENVGTGIDYSDSNDDIETQNAIRAIILKAHGDKIRYSHDNGVNSIRICVDASENAMLKTTLTALVLGTVFGFLLIGVLPESFSGIICKYALDPVKTIFMNSLKMIIAPVVFFSIVSCFSQFKNMTELGRIGAKIIGMYFFTTVIAVFVAIGIASILQPGEWGFALNITTSEVSINTDVDTSLLGMIVGIFPSNFLKPFVESDTLQIIFLATICGIAVGKLGEYSGILRDIFEACNSLFLTVTGLITKFIPIAVFCSAALMITEMGGGSFLSVLGMACSTILTIICMLVIYGIMILIFARLNPITFFKKNREGMLTSFTLCSSSAAMPTNMRTCTDKLGISPKVCSFSIPLGATINMDGTSIFLVASAMFLARAYGVEIPAASTLSLIITIIMLSLAAPGVPGAGIVCLGIVLESIGVPVEGIAFVLGIGTVLDMFVTMSNTTGDVAAALIVAKNEGLVDVEKYNE